jgi:hypothetical protein
MIVQRLLLRDAGDHRIRYRAPTAYRRFRHSAEKKLRRPVTRTIRPARTL